VLRLYIRVLRILRNDIKQQQGKGMIITIFKILILLLLIYVGFNISKVLFMLVALIFNGFTTMGTLGNIVMYTLAFGVPLVFMIFWIKYIYKILGLELF
jgi:hypothetical protein